MQNRRSERYSRDANPALAHQIVHIRHAVLPNRSYPTRNTPKSFISVAKCSNEDHMQTHRLRFLPGRRQKAKARLIILQPTETCTGEQGNAPAWLRTHPILAARRILQAKVRMPQQTTNSKRHSPLHHYARLWARSHIAAAIFNLQ